MTARRPTVSAARGAVISIVAYGLILAGVSVVLGTWTDEEYTLATTAHGLTFAWQRAFNYELQAPLYFGIMAVWREANVSVWFARLFSVLCATGFFALALPIGRRIAPDRDALPFAAIVACNPFVIWAALEVRLYAFALLISALLWFTFDSGFARGTMLLARVAFVVVAIAAIYTQYFLGFLLVAYAVDLFIERRWRSLLPYALALAATAVATVPLFNALHAQVGTLSDLSQEPVTALLRDTVVHPWLDFVMPYDRAWDIHHVRLAYGALLAVIAAAVLYARPRLSLRSYGALGIALAVEWLYLLAVATLHLGLQPRHFIALFFPVLIVAYGLVIALAQSKRPRTARWLVVAHLTFVVAVLFTNYAALAKNGDARRIGPFLTAHANATDAIAVFPADALPAYRRTYAGRAPLLAFPHALHSDRYDDAGLTLTSDEEASVALRKLESEHARVWLIIQGDCDFKRPFYGCDHMYSVVRNPNGVTEHRFYKGRVYEIDTASKTKRFGHLSPARPRPR